MGATLVTLLILQLVHHRPEIRYKMLMPPPPHVEHFSFGFNDVIADGLWLTVIQDFGECTLVNKIEKWRQKKCQRGWSFQFLDAITKLAPRYRMVYVSGAISISVLNDDTLGADVIFERGVENFPNDWSILYRAAYHYMFDMKNKRRAAELLQRAAENGAPRWVHSLAAKLYTEEGELQLALTNLISLRKQITDRRAQGDLDRRINDLQERLRAIKQ